MPFNDVSVDTYICGSDDMDIALIVWTLLFALFVAVIFSAYLFIYIKYGFDNNKLQKLFFADESIVRVSKLSQKRSSILSARGNDLPTYSQRCFDYLNGLICDVIVYFLSYYFLFKVEVNRETVSKSVYQNGVDATTATTELLKDEQNSYSSKHKMFYIFPINIDKSAVTKLREEFALLFENARERDVLLFLNILTSTIRQAVLVTLLSTLLPGLLIYSWSLPSNSNRTSRYQYTWLVSGAYFSGIIPAIVFGFIYIVVCIILVYKFNSSVSLFVKLKDKSEIITAIPRYILHNRTEQNRVE